MNTYAATKVAQRKLKVLELAAALGNASSQAIALCITNSMGR